MIRITTDLEKLGLKFVELNFEAYNNYGDNIGPASHCPQSSLK